MKCFYRNETLHKSEPVGATRNRKALSRKELARGTAYASHHLGNRMESRKFESLLNGWHIDPTPSSVREEWASSETRRGGYNATSYRSPGFDAVIDSAVKEMNPARSTALYRRAYRILTEDAPAMWLYELRNAQGVSKRIRPTGMRPDAWWANLADWTVSAAR